MNGPIANDAPSPRGRAIEIGGRSFSDRGSLIIGEVAQAHDGSLGMAHAFIDAIAAAGADAVKFQTHIASAESTPGESWRVKFSSQDESRYEYWRRMELSEEQWQALKKHADARGMLFLSTPFSIQAIDLLERVGVPAWKVASGEANNAPMLRRLIQTGLPILLSSGMSTLAELDAVVDAVSAQRVPFILFQCTTEYPCGPERAGLNLIPFFRQRYGCPLGLSDHSGTIYAGLAAAALGIEALEVHVTLSREMFGPDVVSSVTTTELRHLVEGVRWIERANANPVDKDALARELEPMRALFTKSVVAERDLPAGTMLTDEHLTAKKPGTGIPVARVGEVLGRRLARDVRKDEMLRESDLA